MSSEITTIDDYFREHGKHHVARARDLLKPLHTPGEATRSRRSTASPANP